MKKSIILMTVCCLLALAQISFGQKKTSSAEEKATFVKGTKLLEQEPFHKDAKKISQASLFWLIEAPDVSVTLCSDFIDTGKYKYSPQVTGQFTFAMGAFIIENPDKAKNDKAIYQAGLESVTRMYEAILAAKPKDTNKDLDKLLENEKMVN